MLCLPRTLRDDEGAATTEFALATLFIIPLILYTMYSGEAFLTAIKAQEAEIRAGWEVSAYRLHAYNGGDYRSLYTNAAQRAETRVNDAMRDLDSFENRGTGWRQAVGNATFDRVECRLRSGNGAGPSVYPLGLPPQLHTDGYVGCQARVRYENVMLPIRPHREFIGNDLLPPELRRMEMCGNGSTVQGCEGTRMAGFVLLTDDWGLERGTQNPVGQQTNREYYNVGRATYQMSGTPGLSLGYQAGQLAVNSAMGFLLGGADQGQTSTFKMGYLTAISNRRNVPSDGRGTDPHLTPWDEEAHQDTNNTRAISQRVYNERRNSTYLGKSDRNYNAP